MKEEYPDISVALLRSFQTKDGRWFQVMYGDVFGEIREPHKVTHLIHKNWRMDEEIVEALRKLGF